jgi:polar amino acid transport system permease protein
VLSYGAYVAEVFRAGIDSIHPSQVASADALGLSPARRCGTSCCRRPSAASSRRCSTTSSRCRRTPPWSSIVVLRRAVRGAGLRAYNFNYTPSSWSRVLFVALTIPLARFTDWLGAG